MSVAKLGSQVQGHNVAQRRVPDWDPRSLAQTKVGEEVTLRIGQKISDTRYLATFGANRYVVESSMQFSVGQMVKATVSAVGGVVELRYRGAGQFEVVDAELPEQAGEANGGAATVDKLQAKYKVSMLKEDRQLVEALNLQVARPESMTAGALYLCKLSAPIDDNALRALYDRQVWKDDDQDRTRAAINLSALVTGIQQGNRDDIDTVAKALGDAIEASSSDVSALSANIGAAIASGAQLQADQNQQQDAKQNSHEGLDELARRLLDIQDSGALSYHYGSLPVMVADQLVELDLVYFRERETPDRSSGLRKLVMTLKTETLGHVEIVAQCCETTLSVSIGTQSAGATEQLASHAQEVRELVGRLGWNVDSVAYRLASEPMRAAEHLIRHVLSSGTLDAVI